MAAPGSKSQQADRGPLDGFACPAPKVKVNLIRAWAARDRLMMVARDLTHCEDSKGRDLAMNTVVMIDDLIEHLDGQS